MMRLSFLQPFTSSLTNVVGIDLGTSRTRMWSDKHGIVINEATCLAIDDRTQKIIAVGDEAAQMKGRASQHINVLFPVKNGQLQDPVSANALLKIFLHRVLKTSAFFRPVMMISVPANSTEGVRQAMVELLHRIGAREVFTISQPLAAAIGAGVPIADASGSFIFHLGSGVAEGALISLGSLVASESTHYAGEYVDQRLQHSLKKSVGLTISHATAQKIKHQVASLLQQPAGVELLVTGKDALTGSPKELAVTPEAVLEPMTAIAERYAQLLQKLLSRIPPELTVDVIDKGMLLTGGLAQLSGLDQFLVKRLGVSVAVVDEPELAVIKGMATALENLELFKESIGYRE